MPAGLSRRFCQALLEKTGGEVLRWASITAVARRLGLEQEDAEALASKRSDYPSVSPATVPGASGTGRSSLPATGTAQPPGPVTTQGGGSHGWGGVAALSRLHVRHGAEFQTAASAGCLLRLACRALLSAVCFTANGSGASLLAKRINRPARIATSQTATVESPATGRGSVQLNDIAEPSNRHRHRWQTK
jgi:hypothetical protein